MGWRMQLDPQEWIQISLLAGQATEPLTAACIEQLLLPGEVFVDVGAHVGWLSLIGAKQVGINGRVIAIDPQPYNCELILTNASLNGFEQIVVIPAAISTADGYLEAAQQGIRDKARFTLDGVGVNDTPMRFMCACMRLDTLFSRLKLDRVKLVKIDVENFELEVLKSAQGVMPLIDNIIYETLPTLAFDRSREMANLLEQAGFELCTVEGGAWQPGETARGKQCLGKAVKMTPCR